MHADLLFFREEELASISWGIAGNKFKELGFGARASDGRPALPEPGPAAATAAAWFAAICI